MAVSTTLRLLILTANVSVTSTSVQPNSTFDALDFPRNYIVENIDLPCDCFL